LLFSAYGVPFEVRSNRPDVLAKVLPFLPMGTKPSSRKAADRVYDLRFHDPRYSQQHVLYRNRRAIVRTTDEETLFDRFESAVTTYVADLAPNRVFVHAGVVAVNGRAVLLPGRSMAGKSTLVSELLRAGATFYSDEFAVLDAKGRVHPYARALQIREGGDWRQTRRPAQYFGAVAGEKPLPVGLIALTRYKVGAHWLPKQLSPGMAVFEMLRHTACARRYPERALDTLRQAVAKALVLQGPRGEVRETVASLLAALAS
jgi:hypothetical protein